MDCTHQNYTVQRSVNYRRSLIWLTLYTHTHTYTHASETQFEGFWPEWYISTSCLRYTILVGNPRFTTSAPSLQHQETPLISEHISIMVNVENCSTNLKYTQLHYNTFSCCTSVGLWTTLTCPKSSFTVWSAPRFRNWHTCLQAQTAQPGVLNI